MLGRHRKKDTLEDHVVTLNRAGQNDQANDEINVDIGGVTFQTNPIAIPESQPNGLWNHGVRGEAVTSGAVRVTDPEAAREELIARATERAERSRRQRDSVALARATGYQLGLDQGRELGRMETERKQRQAENAAFDAEQDKALKPLHYPPLQAMVKHLGPATVVNLTTPGEDVNGEGHLLMATALSVCAPCDVYDREVGNQIAYARALRLMADILEEAAASRTRHTKERY